MAPKEESYLDRHGNLAVTSSEESNITDNGILIDKKSVAGKENLNIQSNQIVIDGVIYSLDNFYHPGGDSIKMFGGNDATVMYKMIHPHHTKEYHTKKMTKVSGETKEIHERQETI